MSESPWFSPHRLLPADTPSCRINACKSGDVPCQSPAVCRLFAHMEEAHDTQPEAASGCYEPPDERPIEDGGGVIVWLAGGIGALFALLLVAHLGAKWGVL